MKGPEGARPRDGTAEAARGGATVTAGEKTASITAAETVVAASNTGARFECPSEGGAAGRDDGTACPRQGGETQPPPEGRAAGREDEIAHLFRDNLELRIRVEIYAEERERAERVQ